MVQYVIEADQCLGPTLSGMSRSKTPSTNFLSNVSGNIPEIRLFLLFLEKRHASGLGEFLLQTAFS